MNKRKWLWARAEAWAARNIDNRVCRFAAAEGFQAGYKAAIRDTIPQRRVLEATRDALSRAASRVNELGKQLERERAERAGGFSL